MRIRTVNFGDLEIEPGSIITFDDGLPGFPQLNKFVILDMEEIKPFQYLQALPDDDSPPIALYLINPFMVEPSYEFRLTDSDMDAIKSMNSTELTIYTVATIPADPREATVNLMAPIVVNEKDRRGRQVILHDSKYSVRHPLMSAADGDDPETENPDSNDETAAKQNEND